MAGWEADLGMESAFLIEKRSVGGGNRVRCHGLAGTVAIQPEGGDQHNDISTGGASRATESEGLR